MLGTNRIYTILGPKGCGKSTLARELVARSDRAIVFDVMSEYGGIDVTTGLENAVEYLVAQEYEKGWTVAIRDLSLADYVRLLNLVWVLRDITLIVEETSLFAPPSFLPEELERIVLRGRHRGISQIYLSQRPARINRTVTSQSDLIVVFRQHEPRDVAYLRSMFGSALGDPGRLPPYKVAVYGSGELPIPIRRRLARKVVDADLFESDPSADSGGGFRRSQDQRSE